MDDLECLLDLPAVRDKTLAPSTAFPGALIDNRTLVRYKEIDLGVLDAIGNPYSRLRATALALRARPIRVRTR